MGPKWFWVFLLVACLAFTLGAQTNLADRAYNNGYDAGYKLGMADGKAGRTSDYSRFLTYRRATSGWDPSTGDREQYRTNFQAGFRDGYHDGHRDGQGSAPAPAPPARSSAPRHAPEENPRPERPAAQEASPARPQPAAKSAPARSSINIAEGTVLRMRLNSTISTRSSRQGDRFTGAVTEPVYMPGSSEVAIPVGSTVSGFVAHVQRPGRVSGTAELQLHYETLALPGGAEYNLQASTSGVQDSEVKSVESGEGTVEGQKTTGRDAAKVGGGAALGAIIGGIAGGGKGAGIGAAIGAGAGLGGVLATRGKEIDLPSGTILEVRLNRALEMKR